MKLSRGQKTLRNFILAALLIFMWWFLLGARPLTVKQAVTWEARRWGLAGEVHVLGTFEKTAVFESSGHLGLARLERELHGIYCEAYPVTQKKETTLLWKTGSTPWGGIPELFLVTQAEAAAADVRLRLRNDVSVGQYTTLHEFQWDEIYSTESKLENGVGQLIFFPKYGEETEFYVERQAETQVLNNLRAALLGYQQQDFAAEVTVILRDASGNEIDTYGEVILDHYHKEETP